MWPLGLYFVVVLAVTATMMGVSFLLGERHRDPATCSPYESGVLPFGSARLRISVQFYLTALFFVIFDLESVFIFAWAVAFQNLTQVKKPPIQWSSYIEMCIFVFILLATLAYLWKAGALDWSRKLPKHEGSYD